MNYKTTLHRYRPVFYLILLLLFSNSTFSNIQRISNKLPKGGFDINCPKDTILNMEKGTCSAIYTFENPTINDITVPTNNSSINTGIISMGPMLETNSSGNWAGVAYNPDLDLYYAGRAGGVGFILNTYNTNGKMISSANGGSDFRGFWWNYCTGELWSDGYNIFGYYQIDLDSSGYTTSEGNTIVPGLNQPNEQSTGDYDSEANEVIFYDNGSIYRYSPTTGALLGSYTIKNLPDRIGNFTQYTVGYTGVPYNEIILYNYKSKQVYFFNKNTGNFSFAVQLPASAPTPNSFGFSYSNGYVFLRNDSGRHPWQSYKIVNNPYNHGSANCLEMVQIEGPKSGTTFPIGTTTVVFKATDTNGYTTTCSFNVTVKDTNAPTAICQDITLQLDATGEATITATDIDNGSSDDCGTIAINIDQTDFDCSMIGVNAVVLSVDDQHDNITQCTANVTIESNVFCESEDIHLPNEFTPNNDGYNDF